MREEHRSDGTARAYSSFSSGSYGPMDDCAEPPLATSQNLYTPISVKGHPTRKHPVSASQGVFQPPPKPGQWYAYGQGTSYLEPSDSEQWPSPSQETKQPQAVGPVFAPSAWEVPDYQQAYWEHLQKSASLPAAPQPKAEQPAVPTPSYLRKRTARTAERMAAQESFFPPEFAASNSSYHNPYPTRPDFSEQDSFEPGVVFEFDNPYVSPEMPIYDQLHESPYEDDEDWNAPALTNDFAGDFEFASFPPPPIQTVYPQSHATSKYDAEALLQRMPPVRRPTPPADETAATASMSLPQFMPPHGSSFFSTPRSVPSLWQRLNKGKLATLAVLLSILCFCLFQVGNIVVQMLENEEEMKRIRQEYYDLNGVDMQRDASQVALLPPGVTYTPTATPAPMVTPTATPIFAIHENAVGILGEQQFATPSPPENGSEPAAPSRSVLRQYTDNPMMNISDEFVALRRENADIVAKLTIEGVLEQTVVQRNNTYYLTHSITGAFSANGAVFADEKSSFKTPPENLLLRGQCSTSASCFAPLVQYRTGGVDFLRQNAIIHLNTLYESGDYVIFAVLEMASGASNTLRYADYPSFATDAEMLEYVEAAKQRSVYQIPIDVAASDRLLTLATVSDSNSMPTLVLLARRLRSGETSNSLSVSLKNIQ